MPTRNWGKMLEKLRRRVSEDGEGAPAASGPTNVASQVALKDVPLALKRRVVDKRRDMGAYDELRKENEETEVDAVALAGGCRTVTKHHKKADTAAESVDPTDDGDALTNRLKEAVRVVGKMDLGPPRSKNYHSVPTDNGGTKVTQRDLNELEKLLDGLFAHYGIDVEFTRHFLDRVNDPRNGKQITIEELRKIFKEAYVKFGQTFSKMKNIEAVLADLQTSINVPFALEWDARKQEIDLITKTVMRKKNFSSSNRFFKV